MKHFRKRFIGLVSIILILVVTTTGYSFCEESTATKDAGTFYQDVPEAKDSFLGAANYFHIFANKANLRNHTNGNVATRELSGDSNFGTQNISGAEYNYAQRVNSINGASGIRDHTKMVFGTGVSVDLSEYHRPKVNGKQMDRISGDDIYQDKDQNVYIDFNAEFKHLNNASNSIIQHDSEKTYYNKDFKNINERVVDVRNYPSNNVYIRLAPEVLNTNTPLIIAGLEKNSGSGYFKNVYITVETGGTNSYSANSQIIFEYTDGSRRGNKETIDFSDSTVLWTFEGDNQPFAGNINLGDTWVGSILAPKATLGGGKNIDGNIIVDEFRGAGETHSWHWQQNKGGVILEKSDESDKDKKLSGAEFSLYTSTGKLVKEKLTTDESGRLKVENLPLGKYYFVETKAPSGYELSNEFHEFEVTANTISKVIRVEVSNKVLPILGGVELIKVDESDKDKKLSGAEFSLYTSTGKLVKEKLTTDESGRLKVENLPLGKYYFLETKAPSGYELSKGTYPFTVEKNQLTTIEKITVTNKLEEKELEYGTVTLKKVDSKNQEIALKGAQFSLYNEKTGEFIKEKIETSNLGEITISKLVPGSYYFKETKAPEGYELSKKTYPFEIKPNEISKIKRMVVTNEKEEPKLGSVELKKVDASDKNQLLIGAEFELYQADGKLLQSSLTTDDSGKLTVDNLAEGSYYFKETKAPEGYELSEKIHPFEIKVDRVNKITYVEVTNEKKEEEKLGSVVLQKLDTYDSGKVLPGAEFSLYKSDGTIVKANLMTDEDGRLRVDNLKEGPYYFIETKAPVGYSSASEKHEFEIKIDEVSQVVLVQIMNTKTEHLGSVILEKSDKADSSIKLSGAEFSLYNSLGELVYGDLITNENGQLSVENLVEGSYYFKETKAPTGYQLSDQRYDFEVKANETSEVVKVEATNEKAEAELGSVLLKKVDQADKTKVLSGAEFSLYTSSNELLHSGLKTDETGQITVSDLAEGSYYFKETKAPTGYQLSDQRYDFEVKANETSEVVKVEATNEKAEAELGSVLLKKVDQADKTKVLSGAEFSLYTSSNELLHSGLKTDETGQITVSDLAEGSYYFKETKAPTGYQLSDQRYDFEVKANETSEVVKVEATNEKAEAELGSVLLKKVDQADKAKVLSGAEFSLYTSSGELIKEKLVTDKFGEIRTDKLQFGKYYFKETKAPTGYKLSKESYSFEIGVSSKKYIEKVTVTNQLKSVKPIVPKEPNKPTNTTSNGNKTGQSLPKTGELSDRYVGYGWLLLLVVSVVTFGKIRKANNELS